MANTCLKQMLKRKWTVGIDPYYWLNSLLLIGSKSVMSSVVKWHSSLLYGKHNLGPYAKRKGQNCCREIWRNSLRCLLRSSSHCSVGYNRKMVCIDSQLLLPMLLLRLISAVIRGKVWRRLLFCLKLIKKILLSHELSITRIHSPEFR